MLSSIYSPGRVVGPFPDLCEMEKTGSVRGGPARVPFGSSVIPRRDGVHTRVPKGSLRPGTGGALVDCLTQRALAGLDYGAGHCQAAPDSTPVSLRLVVFLLSPDLPLDSWAHASRPPRWESGEAERSDPTVHGRPSLLIMLSAILSRYIRPSLSTQVFYT